MTADIEHATVVLKDPQVHAQHPLKNKKNHDALLDYVQDRLRQGKDARDIRLRRMAEVDRSVAGWIRLDDDERKARAKKNKTGTPFAVTMNLPLTFIHLDDMMTYLAATFSPNKGMFEHTGDPKESPTASQIVLLMNNHAIYSGYYRQVAMTCYNILKYNAGGFHGFWSRDQGPKYKPSTDGSAPQLTNEVIWQGNKLESLDMYNTFWDPSVSIQDVHKDAEWAGFTQLRSHYWLANKASQGYFFNLKEALEQDRGIGSQCTYYRSPPIEAKMTPDGEGKDNWLSILSEVPIYAAETGFEVTTVYVRLNPTDFNLVASNDPGRAARNTFEVWRITIVNDKYIVNTEFMNNIHGFIPLFMGAVNDDLMGQSAKSVAEILTPLQDFASFLLNTHIRATRKNIWGLTAYDPSAIDLKEIPEGEVSAKIATKPAAWGKDIRQFIWQNDQVLDTKQTMQDLESVMGIISQFFPTQSLPSQIAGIDRAVDSQVAAVQQGANRRMQKDARLLDDTLFRPLRFSFYYNIIQFQPDGAEVTDFYGKPQKIDLAALRETDLPFIIGQGLKALDKQAAAQALQQIIFAIIQNPTVSQQIDLLGLIDYWTSMIDIQIDMRQFHIQQPQQPQVDPATGQPVAAPDGRPQGIVDPQNVTQPLLQQ